MGEIIRFGYGSLRPRDLREAAQAVSDAFAAKHAALSARVCRTNRCGEIQIVTDGEG